MENKSDYICICPECGDDNGKDFCKICGTLIQDVFIDNCPYCLKIKELEESKMKLIEKESNKIEYNSLLCQCECPECEKLISKDDYFKQGYCFHCQKWILTDEINECDHCKEVRQMDFKQKQEKKNSSIDLNCSETEDYVLGLA